MWYGMVGNERVSILFMIWYGMGFLQMVKREGHASCGLSLCSPSMWGVRHGAGGGSVKMKIQEKM